MPLSTFLFHFGTSQCSFQCQCQAGRQQHRCGVLVLCTLRILSWCTNWQQFSTSASPLLFRVSPHRAQRNCTVVVVKCQGETQVSTGTGTGTGRLTKDFSPICRLRLDCLGTSDSCCCCCCCCFCGASASPPANGPTTGKRILLLPGQKTQKRNVLPTRDDDDEAVVATDFGSFSDKQLSVLVVHCCYTEHWATSDPTEAAAEATESSSAN